MNATPSGRKIHSKYMEYTRDWNVGDEQRDTCQVGFWNPCDSQRDLGVEMDVEEGKGYSAVAEDKIYYGGSAGTE